MQATVHGRVSASNVAPGDFDGMGNSHPKSRAVGFHAFQSGLVQAVEVHKSPRADHVEGGLGGFIDIQPRRPVELGKRHGAFSVDATRNALADDTAPGVFAMYSNVLTDNLGFMVSAQWDNRFFRTDNLQGWSHVFRTVNVDGVEVGSGYYPQQLNAELHTTDRDRLNVSSSLQWQPSDRLDITFDALFSDNETQEADYWRDYRIRQGNGRITEAEFMQDNGETIFTRISTTAGLFLSNQVEEVSAENANLGVNVEFQATDSLVINADASVSETQAPILLEGALMRNTHTQMTWEKYGSGRLPSMTSTDPVTDPDWYQVVWSTRAGHLIDDRLSQWRVDVTYDFAGDWLQTVRMGARAYRQDRRDRSRYLGSAAWLGDPIAAHGGGVAHPAEGNFLSGLGMDFPANTPAPNLDFLIDELANISHEQLFGWQAIPRSPKPTSRTSVCLSTKISITRTTATRSMPWLRLPVNSQYAVYRQLRRALCGQQHRVDREISRPIDIDYSDPTVPQIITSAPVFTEIAHGYTETLPSLNLRFDPTDDIVVRFAAAKVMTRPRFLDLSPRQTVQPRNRSTRGGNGKLDRPPRCSSTWRWSGISTTTRLPRWVSSPRKSKRSFSRSKPQPHGPASSIPRPTNPCIDAFRPLNTGKSDLAGIELAFQRTFADLLPAPWNGLGVITNYTYINSGSDFRNELTGAAYGIPGLSETRSTSPCSTRTVRSVVAYPTTTGMTSWILLPTARGTPGSSTRTSNGMCPSAMQ